MGRLDVDEMLAELTPLEMNRWRAACDVEPQILGWQQAGTITANIVNALRMIADMFVTTKRKFEPLDADDFVPHLNFDEPQAAENSIQKFHSIIRSKFPLK